MSDVVSRYLIKYPSARTSTILQLQRQAETTARLRQEIGMQKPSPKPWWRRAISALIKDSPNV